MLKAEGPKINVLTHSPKFDIFSLSLSRPPSLTMSLPLSVI